MENRPTPPGRDPKIADASALFRDDPAPEPPKPPKRPAVSNNFDDDYALIDVPENPPARPLAPIIETPKAVKASRDAKESTDPTTPPKPSRTSTTATVSQVWSRNAEWGITFVLLAISILGVMTVLYFLLAALQFGLAFFVLLVSAPFLVFVAYPILITLERPVRITPEQAVRDYYTAASHHFPHYRRMWLLLSDEGCVSGSFGSFEGFKGYWKSRLHDLRKGRVSDFTPLKFQIEDFRSEKSAGLSHIGVNYSVNVFIRGKQDEGPVDSFKVAMTLVKGPDRMWYLNKGTLP